MQLTIQTPEFFQSPLIHRSDSPLKEPLALHEFDSDQPTIDSLRSLSKPPSSKEKVNSWHPYAAPASAGSRSSGPSGSSKAKATAASGSTSAQDRPTVPYAQLIGEAIESTKDRRITLNGIYNYVLANYPYFKTASVGWKNSVRHNLSLNKNFVRVPRPPMEKGKGAYWTFSSPREEVVLKPSVASRRQSKAASVTTASAATLATHVSHQLEEELSPYLDVQTFEFPFDQVDAFSSSSPFQSLYQNPNTAFVSDEAFLSTSQQTFANVHQDDFDAAIAGKGMYLDQFERMLAIEQMRQSSQASIETFQNYDGSASSESNAFFDNTSSCDAFTPHIPSHQKYNLTIASLNQPPQMQFHHQQVDYEYVPEHDSSIFWSNGVYDSYLGVEKN